MTKRREFPLSVREARRDHAMRGGIVYCEGCGEPCKPGAFDFDHHLSDAMGGKPTFENCRLLCVAVCHPEKTRRDREAQARADRQRERAKGIDVRKKQKIPVRPKSGPKRAPRPVPERVRPMFALDPDKINPGDRAP